MPSCSSQILSFQLFLQEQEFPEKDESRLVMVRILFTLSDTIGMVSVNGGGVFSSR
jgi:hypothetical protein